MYRWPYAPSSGGSRRSRNISAGSSIARKSDKQFGGLTKEELALGIVVLQSNSAELLARDAHDDSVGEPTRLVGAERPLVGRERPQLHHVQIHAVERVRQQRRHGVPAIALAPCAGLTDVDVQRADAVPAAELIQPDLAHGPSLRLDDERVPLRARAFLRFGDVLLGEGPFVVHPPPDLGLVLPLMDERMVPLLDRPERHGPSVDHPATLTPATRPRGGGRWRSAPPAPPGTPTGSPPRSIPRRTGETWQPRPGPSASPSGGRGGAEAPARHGRRGRAPPPGSPSRRRRRRSGARRRRLRRAGSRRLAPPGPPGRRTRSATGPARFRRRRRSRPAGSAVAGGRT